MRFRAEGQYNPVTVHWERPDGDVGWLRLRHRGPLSATAREGGGLKVKVRDHRRLGRQPVLVESSHPGDFGKTEWRFEGRTIAYDGPPAHPDGVIDAGAKEILRLHLA